MKYLKFFENHDRRNILVLHGLGGSPDKDREILLKQIGYEVIYPHIDYELEWNKDKCKSMCDKELYKDIDIIIGISLGGYLAYILSNELDKPCILINPALDRSKSKLKIKDFDVKF